MGNRMRTSGGGGRGGRTEPAPAPPPASVAGEVELELLASELFACSARDEELPARLTRFRANTEGATSVLLDSLRKGGRVGSELRSVSEAQFGVHPNNGKRDDEYQMSDSKAQFQHPNTA